MQYFGERWNAPAFDDATEAPTPVGEECLYCGEPIAAGDSGILTCYLGDDGAEVVPVHIECQLRAIMGSEAHLEKRCSCYGGTEHDGFSREEARRTMVWLLRH